MLEYLTDWCRKNTILFKTEEKMLILWKENDNNKSKIITIYIDYFSLKLAIENVR
jgi:hypothetical protein